MRFGAQVVRRYDLHYRTGNYGKTLLDRIEARGLAGSNLFYSHRFEYFSTPEDTTGLDLFNAPVPYAITRLASGAERPADGHTHARDTASVVSGGVGIGIPQLNLGIGGTDSQGKELTDWRLFDLSSDSLTDGLAGDGLVNRGSLQGADRLNPAALGGLFTPAVSPTSVGPLSQVQRDFFGAEAGIFGLLNLSTNTSLKNRTRETQLLADMNGDGHVDLFGFGLGRIGGGLAGAALGGTLQVRLNDRQGGFGPPQQWPNYDINGDQLPDHLASDFEGNFRVRLNLGHRFGAPVVWTGGPWGVTTFSARQELLNRRRSNPSSS